MVAKRDQRYSRQPPRALLGFFGRMARLIRARQREDLMARVLHAIVILEFRFPVSPFVRHFRNIQHETSIKKFIIRKNV